MPHRLIYPDQAMDKGTRRQTLSQMSILIRNSLQIRRSTMIVSRKALAEAQNQAAQTNLITVSLTNALNRPTVRRALESIVI